MAKRKRGITGEASRRRRREKMKLRRALLKEDQNERTRASSVLRKCTVELESSKKIKSESMDDSYQVSSEIQEKQNGIPLQTDLQLEKNRKTTYLLESSIKIKSEPLDDSYQASPKIQEKQDERFPLQADVQLQMNTNSSVLKKYTDKLESSIEMKSEPLDDSYQASPEIKKKQNKRLPLQTDLQFQMNRKTNSASVFLPSSSQKKVVNGTPLNKRKITGPSPDGTPQILPKQPETCSVQRNLKNYPVLLPKQPETSGAQRNLQNSPVMLLPANSQNTVGNNKKVQSFLVIITSDKTSSNQPNKQESSNVSQDKQNTLPVVSSPIQGLFSHVKEDQLETAPSKINLNSGNPSKTKKTDHNLNGDINQVYSPEWRDSSSQRNLKFEESAIELAKKQILEEISKNSHTESDDLLFLRSLLPYISKIPDTQKLRFRRRIQEVVDEFVLEQPR